MVDEQEATGLGTGDDADSNGAAGVDLSSELLLSEGVLLPLGLVGALAVANCDEAPVIGECG